MAGRQAGKQTGWQAGRHVVGQEVVGGFLDTHTYLFLPSSSVFLTTPDIEKKGGGGRKPFRFVSKVVPRATPFTLSLASANISSMFAYIEDSIVVIFEWY